MKKKRQKVFLFTSLITIILIFCSCRAANKEEAKVWFSDSQQSLNIVVEFLSMHEYPNILINKADGTMSLLLSETVSIEDERVVDAVRALFSYGFKKISKRQENNSIVFLKQTKFNDFGAGLVCAIDKKDEPQLQYLTKLESLSVEGWYYYEENYNEWRLEQNQ